MNGPELKGEGLLCPQAMTPNTELISIKSPTDDLLPNASHEFNIRSACKVLRQIRFSRRQICVQTVGAHKKILVSYKTRKFSMW